MDRRLPLALGLDTFSVTLFIAIGRAEHGRDSALVGLIETAAPFLIALAAGWLLFRAWKRPADWRVGIGICAVTVAVGMLLRAQVFDGGTATSFVLVTAGFLALFLVGWRLALALVEHWYPPVHADNR